MTCLLILSPCLYQIPVPYFNQLYLHPHMGGGDINLYFLVKLKFSCELGFTIFYVLQLDIIQKIVSLRI